MSIFSKLFGSKKIDEEQAENNEALSQGPEVFDDPAMQEVIFEQGNAPTEDTIPATLPEAIRYVVEKWGKDYLLNRGFVNVLNDFKVLKDMPAAKHIITNMQASGYVEKICLVNNWEIESKSIVTNFATEFGAREDIVSYVVQCIGYGLRKCEDVPKLIDDTNKTEAAFKAPSFPQSTPQNKPAPTSPQSQPIGPYNPHDDLPNYRYPTLDLLNRDLKPYIDMTELTDRKDHIVGVLRALGIEISMIKTTIGSIFTLHEIALAPGVLISKVRKLEKDIVLSLLSPGVQLIVPIPGRGTIGVLFPNTEPTILSIGSLFNSKVFQESSMELPCAVGKTLTNDVFMIDLTEAPHLLIAGATGQGKSVSLNVIITSLLYKKHPAEMKLVLIDLQKVEFGVYQSIANHFLAKVPDDGTDSVITDVTKAVQTLNSLCIEIDARYNLLKTAAARNIKEYNKKYMESRLNSANGHRYLPYVVVLINEFSDLMSLGKEAELPIARIGQMAHVVGIHMIIATQRFSTRIITENIKNFFPSRFAFRVLSASDSKAILDCPDAQKLMVPGDMLYQKFGGVPVRIQCAFVDTSELSRITQYIARQQGYNTVFELPNPDLSEIEDSWDADVDMSHLDPMFGDAARLVVVSQSGSTSLIQRKFAIGYNRAGRLMNQLEKAGIVSAAIGSKPREVLIQDEYHLNNLLKNLL